MEGKLRGKRSCDFSSKFSAEGFTEKIQICIPGGGGGHGERVIDILGKGGAGTITESV